MSYQALARKYRPQRFADMIGQDTVVRTLQNAIESGRIHHAYLFSGVRGVGKTTAARILAKALNCKNGPAAEPCNECTACREITEGIDLDVREIDAATYTGVDNIRELREVTQFQPARDRHRVFIIDEAHMLSTGAWNALLKILEEPPPHVVFMFATTEVNKVPQTILSRVQKFAMRKITLAELIGRLEQIAKEEKIDADRAALETIARRGEGSVRDALSLLDQVIAFSGRSVRGADVATVLGLSDTSFFGRIVDAIADGDHTAILEALQEAADSGRDFKLLYRDLLGFTRNLLLLAGGAGEHLIGASPEDLAATRAVAGRFSYTELLRVANLLIRDDETVNKAEHQRLAVEIALLKAATFPRLQSVEQALAGGTPAAPPSREKPRREPPRRPEPEPSRESAPPARQTPAQETEQRSAPPSTGDLAPLMARIQKSKPGIAARLAQAAVASKEGTKVIWRFEDATHADYVNDAREVLEQLAAAVYGEQITIEATGMDAPKPTGRRAEDKPSPLRDDPVIRAFQKHLGADIVGEK